jgi:hypothetical protein
MFIIASGGTIIDRAVGASNLLIQMISAGIYIREREGDLLPRRGFPVRQCRIERHADDIGAPAHVTAILPSLSSLVSLLLLLLFLLRLNVPERHELVHRGGTRASSFASRRTCVLCTEAAE